MKRNTMFKSLLALVLVLALGSGTMLPRQTLAQGTLGITGAASTSLSASLGTGFTYQGHLTDAGGPVDDTCALTFKLYDEAGTGTPPTGGTLLGTVSTPSEEVSDGYFTVQLDFGSGVFTGDARWLEIAVDCGSGATTLSPRQELTAAPYALYAMSAPWAGLSGIPAGFVDNTDNTDDTVAWSEISGIVGAGANQVAAGNHDHWGETWSGTGTGLDLSGGSTGLDVSGGSIGLNASGGDYAVRGRSDSGYGVYGRSNSGYGVHAMGAGGDLQLYDGTIFANRLSSSDLALHSNDYVDVHLDDDSNSTSQLRVLNDADTAVFTVNESGDVSWQAQTGYVSVSAAAFRPQEDGYDFTNSGWRIMNINGSSDYYYAPVQLPHGATVTRMTFYWYDMSSAVGNAYLRRSSMDATWSTLAHAATSGIGGAGSSFDDDILNATIDNSQYAYYLHWILPNTTVHGYGVVIQHTYTGPH